MTFHCIVSYSLRIVSYLNTAVNPGQVVYDLNSKFDISFR